MTSGLPLPSRPSPRAVIAAASAWQAAAKSVVGETLVKAAWITPFGRGGAGAQAGEVIERAAAGGRAGLGQRLGRGLRPGEAGDLVSRVLQLADDGGTDESGRAGNEHAHDECNSIGRKQWIRGLISPDVEVA
jgi:hypothetical protein